MSPAISFILFLTTFIPSLLHSSPAVTNERIASLARGNEPGEVQEEGDRLTVPVWRPEDKKIPQRVPGVAGPSLSAKSALVVDTDTGKVLYAKNRDVVRPLASLTKLMTALVAVDLLPDRTKKVTIIKADEAGGGRLLIRQGDEVTVEDLFYLALVSSSNDAALALARATGKSRAVFVSAMNARARRIGLTRARFTDPTGLDAGNVATAKEVVPLLQAVVSNPFLQRVVTTKEYRLALGEGKMSTVQTTNKLLGNRSLHVLGGKTGYIDESGYNFAIHVQGTKGETLTIVLLGNQQDTDRFTQAKALLEWAEKAWKF
ncbi:MAG: D-alanyl-D-alanine carboxypeptidase family protein [Patescibacteria group bacterium]